MLKVLRLTFKGQVNGKKNIVITILGPGGKERKLYLKARSIQRNAQHG